MDPLHFWYSILGLLVGSLFLAGSLFCLNLGRSGRATMRVKLLGIEVEISTSVPCIWGSSEPCCATARGSTEHFRS
jgi:hypothetical protein